MRNRIINFTIAFMALSGPVAAQDVAPNPTPGTVELSMRGSNVNGDAARFDRYRDLRDQGAGLAFNMGRDTSSWTLKARGRNVGYRDQRYDALAANGRLTVRFQWTQTPVFYGELTATPYVQTSPGVFSLDRNARIAVQNGTALGIPLTRAQAQNASIYRALSSPFDLRAGRSRAVLALAYAATRALALKLDVDTSSRSGAQPWGGAFGFSVLPEVPLPLDNRTTNIDAGAEWANRRGMLRIGYEGSYFSNNIQTLMWDNPVRAADYSSSPRTVTGYDPTGYLTGNGAATGRMALAPGNHSHGINTQGMVKLAALSTLTAGFGVVDMTQNEALIPWTSNPVIANSAVYQLFPGLASLPRATADADVRMLNGNVNFTAKPARYFGLAARYRFVDRNDRTPAFDATNYVRLDATPMAGGSISRQLNYTRNTANVDATFTPMRFTAVGVGVGRDVLEHSRAYSRLGDTTLRLFAHVSGYQYAGIRVAYERTARHATGFNETVLTAVGSQPASRWFDDADRTRHRTTVLVDVTPLSFLSLNGSGSIGRDRYDDSRQQFGLLDNDNTGYTAGAAIALVRGVSFGGTYGRERYTSLQRSRAASVVGDPSFSDPRRNWNLNSGETVRTISANLDLVRTFRQTEIRLTYDWTDSDQGFVYSGPRIDTLTELGQFLPLPAVTNEWQRARADVRYFFTPRVGVGGAYWYDRYAVQDYQTLDLAPGVPRTDAVGTLMLGYGYRPFRANTGFVRLIYQF